MDRCPPRNLRPRVFFFFKLFYDIHTATIAGKPVRFFRAPSGKPELVWHAANDLFVACGFSEPMREHFRRSLQEIFGTDIQTIATSSGPVTIAPHVAAQGLLGAAADVGEVMPPRITEEYALGAAEAMNALMGDLPPAASVEFLCQAARNSGIGE